jgi:hypothetical protein
MPTRHARAARASGDAAIVVASIVGVWACALSAAGCSTPTETQPFAGTCAPLRVLQWTPNGGALDVPRDTTIRLVLDDYPDPDTVDLGGFIVTTGVFYHPGVYAVDLLDKTISFRASGTLFPDLGYNLTIRPALQSLHGCPALEERRSFRTSATSAMPPAMPPESVPFAQVQPIFARACAGGACHRAASDGPAGLDGCLPTPAAGLSLCDRDAVRALVGVPSRQVSRLHLVEANDSTRSYLLRKLLPGDAADRPAPTALGHRDPPGAPLPPTDLRALASWIDTGANP